MCEMTLMNTITDMVVLLNTLYLGNKSPFWRILSQNFNGHKIGNKCTNHDVSYIEKMRKCPPGTCSANALNVKFGNISLNWQCLKCIFIREAKIWMIFEYPWCPNIWCSNIHDAQISMMSKYPRCPNIHDIWLSMIS